MKTSEFNLLDKFIAKRRLNQIKPYVSKNDVVLDFGCGYQSYLLKNFEGMISEGIGLDYDVEPLKTEKIEHLKFRFTDKFEFSNSKFDKIFMLAVLEHIPLDTIDKLMKEFTRILKDDGLMIFTTPTPKSKPVLEFLAYRLKIISEPEIRDHKKYYNEKDVIELCQRNGLVLKHYKTFQFGLNSMMVISKK